MKKIHIVVVFLAAIFISSCGESEWLTDGDYFFLENKDATMPVWVKGNLDADIYILTVHGGPLGTSGHEFPISKGFKLLEEDYAVIYWDQRMSGLAQGNPDISTLSIEQHYEDLDKLVQLIKHKYNPGSLFLLGHSWGGVMTGGYLGRESYQENFKGWIDMDGSLQEDFEMKEMRRWALEKAEERYDENPEFCQLVIDWYAENPNIKQSTPQIYWFASGFNGYAYDYAKTLEMSPVPYVELALQSPYTLAFYWSQQYNNEWVDGFDVTQEVSQIEIPTLFLWGTGDGIVTTKVAEFAYSLLKTKEEDKHLAFIEECAHSPHYDQPVKFYNAMKTFIEQYK